MSNISATFACPPLDDSMTIDQLYDWHRVHSANATAFVFPNNHGEQSNLTWKALGEGIIQGAEIIQRHIREINGEDRMHQQDPIVVGILATTDVITYTTFLFSHIRLTHLRTSKSSLLPFPISTRNSPAAVAHLVHVTGIKYLWVSEGPMRALVNEALSQGGLSNTVIMTIPSFSELYPDIPSASDFKDSDYEPIDLDQPALILHSSGSTAFPKPRTLTHRVLLEISRVFESGDFEVQDDIMAVHGSPLFHGMGIFAAVWPATSGFIRAAPSPRVTVPPTTPEGFLQQIVESKSTTLFCVPSFLEAWSTEPASVQALKKLKAIFWGGAPLKSDVGRFLLKEGVLIHNFYGATEFGCAIQVSAKPYAEGYEWFRFPPHIYPVLVPEEGEEGVYELVFKDSDLHHLSAHNSEIDGVPAYASSDLIERHESNPNLFKIKGRKDDQIMLSTGEKTNPGPLENIIVKSPHVKDALMFGRGRLSNGILIEPTSYEDVEKIGLEGFRNLFWPSIEEANDFAPAHSRIFKEMILVASASKPFTYTAKNNARRGAIIKDYDQEIEAIYQAVQESSHTDIPIPPGSSNEGGWTLNESLEFVRKAVHAVMTDAEDMGDDDDLFGFGCDSLQATYIRNTLLHGLRQVAPPANVQKAPSNFVYQHPTIGELAAFAAQVSHSSAAAAKADHDVERNQYLHDFVAKYTQSWPTHRPSNDAVDPTDETMLVTGSTGGLGSQLLAQLVVMPSVSRIYAFNRPSRKTSRERHVEAFLDRGNDVSLLDSAKITYIEGDTAVEGFNIDPKLFAEIRDSVTTIIHNAWRVDFNISLASFEPAVRGVRYMIDLALQSPHSSPPRVMFTSSVGVVKGWSDIPPVAESPIIDLRLVNNSGYSESKWVSERLLWTAGQLTPLQPVIIRVGQLSGGINGNWNSREWFPALTRASQVVGGVPDNDGLVSFLPLHVAASALIELRHTSSQFIHLVHPRPVPWATVIRHVADALNVPVIRYDEWLDRLVASPKTDEALHRNPALHLVDFYRVSATPKDVQRVAEREAMGLAMYETKIAAAEAPALSPAQLPQLEKDEVNNWVGYWRSKGALEV